MILALALAVPDFPIDLQVDARDANRGVIRVTERIPVNGRRLDLYLPKWIPGDHSPDGPIQSLTNLQFRANGQTLIWRRDPVEMYRFSIDVPAGSAMVEASFTNLSAPGDTYTTNMARVKWGSLALSPIAPARSIRFKATLRVPAGWGATTALSGTATAADTLSYPVVDFAELQDSPVLTAKNLRVSPLGTVLGAPVRLVTASEDANFAWPEATERGFHQIPLQFETMLRSRHFRHYDFLVGLTGASAGLEHHESSEDDLGANDPQENPINVGMILTHEMFHSWNGKFRRPAGLATPDFLQPMHGELLWVYEGLTQYYGYILGARCGLLKQQELGDAIAGYYNYLASSPGRRWRSVADTAVSAQLTFGVPPEWLRSNRRTDFYYEGMLTWLEADCLIRRNTKGRQSLDDFCRVFLGGGTNEPVVVPYSADDVYAALKRIYPYDWKQFFQDRLYRVDQGAPGAGIRSAGYEVYYSNEPSKVLSPWVVGSFSYRVCGMSAGSDGSVTDLDLDGPGFKSGINIGDTIEQINGKPYSLELLHRALAETTGDIVLQLKTGTKIRLANSPDPAIPHLRRAPGTVDVMASITAPLAR